MLYIVVTVVPVMNYGVVTAFTEVKGCVVLCFLPPPSLPAKLVKMVSLCEFGAACNVVPDNLTIFWSMPTISSNE